MSREVRNMTRATAMRWPLFVALFFTWPFPLFGLEGSLIPAARFLQLAASLSVLLVLEGAGGMVGVLHLLLWAHVTVYGVSLFVGSVLVTRQLESRLPARYDIAVATLAIAALCAWGILGKPYDTQFHHSDVHASIPSLYR